MFQKFLSEKSHSAEKESLSTTTYLYGLQNFAIYTPHWLKPFPFLKFLRFYKIVGMQPEASTVSNMQ